MKKSKLFWVVVLLICWSVGTASLIIHGMLDRLHSYKDVLSLIGIITNILLFSLLLLEGISRFNDWLDK